MNTPTLHEYLKKKLEQKRKGHPSFRLMEIDDKLFPDGIIKFDTEKMEARASDDELKTVKKIIAESWKKRDNNHLMIEGEGGLGKTVTLLCIPDKFTPFPVPAIYIPLHELTRNEDPIEHYIKKWILNNKEDLFEQLLNLVDQPWDKGPQLLLLLDGFNEIATEKRQIISEDIEHWSVYPGIQIITSSRYDIHTYVTLSYDCSAIKLQPLSYKTVESYLDSIGVPMPVNDVVIKLITNPLLLTLYVKTELILRQRETDFSDFKEVKNAGSIVWNYLQCELWRFEKEEGTVRNAILTMEFIAPFIAWGMQQKSLFVLEKKEFNKLLEDAYKLLKNHFNKPDDFPFHIQEALQNVEGIPPLELIKNLMEKHLCLYIKNKQQYRLMHQQFRDALAAIYLINSSYLSGENLPKEWETPIDYYVMQFVVDLISEEEATRLWEQNRKTVPTNKNAMRNQLRLQRLLHNNVFSHLNFSGLDLSNISLFPYRVNQTTVILPSLPVRLNNTKISKKTFSPEGHDGAVFAVAVTPNGKRIVSGSRDGTILVWDLETGVPIGEPIEGHNGPVYAVAVTPDGKRIVSGSRDCLIRVWNMDTGAPIGKPLKGHKCTVTAIAVTPDGKRIVSGSYDKTIRVWDIETCMPIGEPFRRHEDWVSAVAVTPDGNHIVSGSYDNTIRVWSMKSDTQKGKPFMEHNGPVRAIVVTPDGKHIVSGSYDNTIRVWDMEAGTLIGEPIKKHQDWVAAVAVTPDGKYIISGSYDNTICVMDIKTGASIREPFKLYNGPVYSIAVTPDGKHIVSGSKSSILHVWDIESNDTAGKPIVGNEYAVTAIAVTHDGKRIISGSDDHTIRIWDMATGAAIGKPIEGHKGGVTAVAVTSDGKRIVSGSKDRTIRVWDLEKSTAIGNPIEDHKGSVDAVAVTPDGKRIVSGSWDNSIRIWDLESGILIRTIYGEPYDDEGHTNSVKTVDITPDGKRIVSGSMDKTIRIWDLKTGTHINTIEVLDDGVSAVAVTPNGKRIVSVLLDNTIRIWDLETGKRIGKPFKDHKDRVNTVAITYDGKRIISGFGNIIYIKDIGTQEDNTIHIHPLSFVGLDFSKASISDAELKETLRQNGAKV